MNPDFKKLWDAPRDDLAGQHIDMVNEIARLREEVDQRRARAEAAEAELREERRKNQ